jgi:transposase
MRSDRLCDLIAPPDRSLVVVGFGDWKGGHKSPVRRRTIEEIKLTLQARRNVKLAIISEFRTAITCSCCMGRLVNMVAKTTIRQDDGTKVMRDKKFKVHKVLHCNSRTCRQEIDYQGTTWNRDVNASRNILELTLCVAKGMPRP